VTQQVTKRDHDDDRYKDYGHNDDYDDETMDNLTQIFYFRILLKQEYSCWFFRPHNIIKY